MLANASESAQYRTQTTELGSQARPGSDNAQATASDGRGHQVHHSFVHLSFTRRISRLPAQSLGMNLTLIASYCRPPLASAKYLLTRTSMPSSFVLYHLASFTLPRSPPHICQALGSPLRREARARSIWWAVSTRWGLWMTAVRRARRNERGGMSAERLSGQGICRL